MIERKHRTLTLVFVLVDAFASCLALVAAYWLVREGLAYVGSLPAAGARMRVAR